MTPRNDRDPSDPLLGRLLDGRYRIGPRIARGGMASVHEALDTRLDRLVAVKVMHPGMGDDTEFARRFVREARAAAKLHHPNVVAVFDQGDDDGTVFLAMEYVAGHTLRDVIRKEAPMPPAKALALLEPVLSALGAAHQAGLVHRDIKPENVLISDAGQVKVADFGLARAVSADTQHTATGGVLIGTVSYLAPELVVDGKADTRADVYAAGVVLYELLTGRKPHEGESPIQVAYKHVHEDVPAPSELVPGLPAYVDALVARATARDRSHRPADARVLLHQLHRVRTALDEGLAHDPDLVADLALPTGTAAIDLPDVEDGTEPTGELEQPSTEPGPTGPPPGFTEVDPDGMTSRLDREAVLAHDAPGRPLQAPSRPTSGVTAPPPRRRRGLVLLVGALVVALAVALGSWWFGWARWTTMPSVVNKTEAAAVAELEQAGFQVEVEQVFDEEVVAGNVVATDPRPGERVLDNGDVTVQVSKGQERYAVPTLGGLTEAQAREALEETNLQLGRVAEEWHDTVPKGQVIRSDPAAATQQKRDTEIDVWLSKGPEPVPVQDFTNKPLTAAKAYFEPKGVKLAVTEAFSGTVAKGTVISQDPRTGETHKGQTVTLVVSKGPELVAVPRVRGMGVAAARRTLQDAGFKVETRESSLYVGLGYVGSVSPGEGELVPKGSTVTLYLV